MSRKKITKNLTRFVVANTTKHKNGILVKMVLLNNEEFLTQLTLLTSKARNDSSFTVTFKRYDGHDKPKPREGKPPLPPPNEYQCLIRAKSKSKKLSTVVNQNEVMKFMEAYSKVMKGSMDGLKKVKKLKTKSKVAHG